MKEHSCTLMEKYIKLIQQGKKTTEARVAIPMFRQWKIGDTIRFFSRRNPDFSVRVRIIGVNSYPTFRKMVEAEGAEHLIPGILTNDAAVEAYLNIPKYADREKEHGVLAFQLELM